MDFEIHYTEGLEEFRKEVRAFIEENAYKEPVQELDPMKSFFDIKQCLLRL